MADVDTAKSPSMGVVLLKGIFLVIVGLLFIVNPGLTTAFVVELLGFYFLVVGIVSLVQMFYDKMYWAWRLISGILGIILGLLIIDHPLWSTAIATESLVVLFGIVIIIMGIIEIVISFKGAGWGTGILGIITFLIGVIVLANPLMTVVVLIYLLGFLALIGGIVSIIAAFGMKK